MAKKFKTNLIGLQVERALTRERESKREREREETKSTTKNFKNIFDGLQVERVLARGRESFEIEGEKARERKKQDLQ